MLKNVRRLFLSSMFLFALSVSACFSPFTRKKMIKYYSDDNNYHQYRAEIKELEEKKGRFCIESIFSLENNLEVDYINYISAQVFSTNIEQTLEELAPHEGLVFDFTGTLATFFSGCPAAIVQITISGKEILTFDDGKRALLEWASTVE